MPPIDHTSQFGIAQHAIVKLKLRNHHIIITAFQHSPINQTLVLSCHRSSSPFTIVRSVGTAFIDKTRIKSKEPAIKLRGIFTECVTSQHIAVKRIVSRCSCRLTICHNKATLPEIVPPTLRSNLVFLRRNR